MSASSYSRPDRKYGNDSASIWPSTSSRIAASCASSYTCPRPSAAALDTIDSTPASCCGPITADFALGQVNRNLGSYARPHIPLLPAPYEAPMTTVRCGTLLLETALTISPPGLMLRPCSYALPT